MLVPVTAVAFLADSACPLALQNFFRSYPKLAGMTGTAATEVAEFNNIYNLNVAVVPTNKVRTVPRAVQLPVTAPDSDDSQHAEFAASSCRSPLRSFMYVPFSQNRS